MPTEKLIVIVENKSKTIKPPTEGAKINVKIAGIYGLILRSAEYLALSA